jgi:hypothetical protein
MTEPFLRIPLSEAEAHRAELASTKAALAEALARVAALEARYEPPCGCGCQEEGEHWSNTASAGDSRGGTHSGFSTIERALVFVTEEGAGARFTDGRHPWDPRTMVLKVNGTRIGLDAAGNFFALVGDLAPPAKKAKAKKAKPVEGEPDNEMGAA